MSSKQPSNIMQKAVCLSIDLGKFGTRRSISTDQIECAADKDMIHAAKEILESDILSEISRDDAMFKNKIKRKCLPSVFKESIYFLPTDMIERVDLLIEEYRKKRAAKVRDFIENEYEQKKEDARKRLDTLFNASDYPTKEAVASAFYFKTAYVSFTTPDTLRTISNDIYQREMAKAKIEVAEQMQTIKTVLRTGFADFVRKLTERLEPTVDGCRKTFKDTLVGNIQEFMDDFAARNIANDGELATLVKKAKLALKGVSAPMLRDDDTLRENVAVSFTTIQKSLDKLLVEAPKRRLKIA